MKLLLIEEGLTEEEFFEETTNIVMEELKEEFKEEEITMNEPKLKKN